MQVNIEIDLIIKVIRLQTIPQSLEINKRKCNALTVDVTRRLPKAHMSDLVEIFAVTELSLGSLVGRAMG